MGILVGTFEGEDVGIPDGCVVGTTVGKALGVSVGD